MTTSGQWRPRTGAICPRKIAPRTLARVLQSTPDVSCKLIICDDRSVADLLGCVELGEIAIGAPPRMAATTAAMTADVADIETLAAEAHHVPHDPFAGWSRRIWDHAMARAVAMRLLAERRAMRRLVDPTIAYWAGLLVDVGAPSLLRWWAEGASGGPMLGPATIERITASVRAHHEAVGAALLLRWGFDPFTVHLARNHHARRPCDENPYWALAIVGEILAGGAAADCELNPGAPPPAHVREACCAAARFSVGELRRLAARVTVDFQALRARLDGTENKDVDLACPPPAAPPAAPLPSPGPGGAAGAGEIDANPRRLRAT